jgi:hypothetical protein
MSDRTCKRDMCHQTIVIYGNREVARALCRRLPNASSVFSAASRLDGGAAVDRSPLMAIAGKLMYDAVYK